MLTIIVNLVAYARFARGVMVEEQLLNAWLSLSLAIGMEHHVNEMPFNESMICNILYMQELYRKPLMTASELCEQMHMHKSQMNRTLNAMEEKGYINRKRDEKDKRKVYVSLIHDNLSLYKKQHKRLIGEIHKFIEKYGEEKTKNIIVLFNELNTICKEVFIND